MDEEVLKNINLTIPKGKVTAIVGTSGSGKTTLVKLLLGFYPPTKGNIRLGGIPLATLRKSTWRQKCGAVMQDGFIFSESIAHNITESDENINKVKLLKAVQTANIQEFIESLPLGYNTTIGPRGNGISQGQRQRMLIAMAVYKNPDFLFFDEATTTLIQQAEEIRLNDQNETDQILGNPPGWLLRFGMTLLFLVAIVFVMLAWLIKYPDIITAKVQLLTENPAIRVVPYASGKMEELLVENQQSVEKNQLLAVLENPIQRKEIAVLEAFLTELEQIENPKEYLKLKLPEHLSLGNLQNGYAALIQKIKDHQHFLKQTNLYQKIAALEKQIIHTENLNGNLKKQQGTLEKEVGIAQKNYLRNQQLNKEGVISDFDLEQIETAYLQYQRQLDNFESQIINNKVQVEQLQTQILDLKQNRKDGQLTKELGIQENIQNLKSQIGIWKQSYLITAPIAGKVNLTKVWSKNQYVTAGQELLTIVPTHGAGKVIGKALVPVVNFGKVKTGQAVHLRLDGFPYQEYGILKTQVQSMALVPQEEHYTIELLLPDTLITTYQKTIPFTQEMQGTANVISEDRRILERVFDRAWSLIKNN